MRLFLKFILFVCAACIVQRFCHKQTDGFAIEKISSHLPHHPEWDADPAIREPALKAILDQKFSYLGKGAQCYAFQSADGKYVLKFFRHSHMRPPFWAPYFPLASLRDRKIQKMESKLRKDFNSYKIAFDEMREETGLLFLHLNKTSHLKQSIRITDKLGVAHVLDADGMEFLVQKKAKLVYPALLEKIERGEIVEAKACLKKLVDLLVLRCQKGIFDKDPDLNTNFGFVENEAVQIDIGRFRKEDKQRVSRAEITRITANLKQWLDGYDPELAHELQEEIRALPL